jgi:hypothetical protein
MEATQHQSKALARTIHVTSSQEIYKWGIHEAALHRVDKGEKHNINPPRIQGAGHIIIEYLKSSYPNL